MRRFDSGVRRASTPCKLGTTDRIMRYLDSSVRENSTLAHHSLEPVNEPQTWQPMEPWTLKYVDDVNAGERHYARNAASTFSHVLENKRVHAIECQRIFERILANAGGIGMTINQKKTQFLCISVAIHSEIRSYITLQDSSHLENQDKLTLLGFAFGNRPNVNAHMDLIFKKFNIRVWLIRHLKRSGVPDTDIAAIFASTICSVIEYACPVYGPRLTTTQQGEIEKMQRRILKIIYGHKISYKKALKITGLQTMSDRRAKLCEKFTDKSVANQRWAKWFPLNLNNNYPLRKRLKYREDHATTNRLYKSPVYTMRRFLNS